MQSAERPLSFPISLSFSISLLDPSSFSIPLFFYCCFTCSFSFLHTQTSHTLHIKVGTWHSSICYSLDHSVDCLSAPLSYLIRGDAGFNHNLRPSWLDHGPFKKSCKKGRHSRHFHLHVFWKITQWPIKGYSFWY